MKLLVIGGTEFVGRAVVEEAVARGHDVTVFHRGRTEPEDLPRVEHLHGDRDGGLDVLSGRTWDVALDTCGYLPRLVRDLGEALAGAVGHYGFVSTLSVLADDMPPGSTESTAPHAPPYPDTEDVTWETYGPLKVACEEEARAAFPGRCLIVRPGYVVGPHDPTDRFTYWVRRAASGATVLSPAPADEVLQVVDARDLSVFTLDRLMEQADDTFGVVGPAAPLTWSRLLETARDVAGADTTFTWVDDGFLRAQLGDEMSAALPLWDVEYPGLHRYDASKAAAAGLHLRPVAETIDDLIAWDRGRGRPALGAGLTADRERELLDAWRSRGA